MPGGYFNNEIWGEKVIDVYFTNYLKSHFKLNADIRF